MVGKKGRSGRKKKYNDPWHAMVSRNVLKHYYRNREVRLKYAREYHKKIKDYSLEHNITFDEARKILAEKRKESEK